jgi:hypothetical protein
VEKAGLPLDILLLLVVVMPCCVALFFGLFAWRNPTPMLFRCRRCDGDFRAKPWKPFPDHCPFCRTREWNLPS